MAGESDVNNKKKESMLAFLLAMSAGLPGVCLAEPLPAEAMLADAGDQSEMADLLAIIEEQTEIATKSKLNADYVPGMVTVLKGDEMAVRGMRTVAEALGQVVGIDTRIDRLTDPKLVVRGTGEAFASGNIKYMLNGVDLIDSDSGYSPLLNMPIANVQRIEVIRGPGSAVYGEFAYTGVVNVITRREQSQVYLDVGQNEHLGGGATLSMDDPGSDLSVNLNVSTWQTTGKGVRTGQDFLYGLYEYTYKPLILPLAGVPTFVEPGVADLLNDPAATSNAPGYSHEQKKSSSVTLDARYADSEVLLQWMKDEKGDGFGTVNTLSDVDGLTHQNTYYSLTLSHRYALSRQVSASLKAGALKSEGDYYAQAFPSNFVLMEDDYICQAFGGIPGVCPTPLGDYDSSPDVVILPAGFLGIGHTEEIRRHLGVDFSWRPSERHNVLLALEGAWIDLVDAWEENNLDLATNEYTDGAMVRRPRLEAGAERDILSITLQDEFKVTDNLDLTLGLRRDDYSDVGINVSPRVAAVWRLHKQHILKAQYAEAFRPPTFWEAARGVAGQELKPQTIDTYELAYIFRDVGRVARATLFMSDMKNLISEDSLLNYLNQPGVEQKGAEFEIEARLSDSLRLDANAAYLDMNAKPGTTSIYGYNDWLSHVGLAYQPVHGVTVYGQVKHVSDFYREAIDARDKLSGYTTADLTVSVIDRLASGAALRLGIKNLTDAEMKVPAPYALDGLGNKFPTYVGDYPRPGRLWWMELSYEF